MPSPPPDPADLARLGAELAAGLGLPVARGTVALAGRRLRIVGIGWATVELERAARDLGLAVEGPPVAETLLGATARATASGSPGPVLVFLEPTSEGRLAARLARHDEGPAALYLAPRQGGQVRRAPDPTPIEPTPAVPRTRAGAGLFGPTRLVLGVAPDEVQLLLIEATGPLPGREPSDTPRTGRTGYHRPMTDQPVLALRPAAAADADRIAALFTDEGYPAAASSVAARLERFTGDGSGRVIVAEDGGEILGFVAVHLMPRFEHDDIVARILALVVDAGARGRGVGRELMDAAEEVARAAGSAFIEVTAGHHRPDARRLYESVGYDASVTAYLRKRL